MPLRFCRDCGILIPLDSWDGHRTTHRGRQRNGRYGSTRQWRKTRAQVIDRDGGQCVATSHGVRCPATERLEVHHIDGNWRNNDPANLVTLCPDHHPR